MSEYEMEARKSSNEELLSIILTTPGFLNYDLKGKGIEVKSGRYSPIYLNMKATWSYPNLLSQISKRLADLCQDCDYVIGIETGGSPYASLIARDLKKKLVLARKEAKEGEILAGYVNYVNEKGKKFAVVDDILATGKSSERGFLTVKNQFNTIRIVSILSYGMDELISKKYNLEVKSLYQIDDLLNSIESNLKIKLLPHVRAYQEKLKEIINT